MERLLQLEKQEDGNMSDNHEIVCKKGDVIFHEGSYGSSIFRILSGSVEVYANYGKAGQKVLRELHQGDYFGEMAVIEFCARSATIVASADDTKLAEIDATDLSGYLEMHRDEFHDLSRQLGVRLRAQMDDYAEVCATLRELGASGDRMNESLLGQIKKFARVWLSGQQQQNDISSTQQSLVHECDRALAFHCEGYNGGDVIFSEGDQSDCLCYIHTGTVGFYKNFDTDDEKKLTEMTQGMFFGELGLFDGTQRAAVALALEDDTYVERVYEKDLDMLVNTNPMMAMMMLQQFSNRLRKVTVDYLKACRALAEVQTELEENASKLSKETRMRAARMDRQILAPEVMF